MAEATLTQLHDLALPPAIPAWPPAPAASLLLALLGSALLMWARRWRSEAYRRRALAALGELERACAEQPQRLSELPALLKYTALQAWPRERVAALDGDAWLDFLAGQAPGLDLPAALGELGYWSPQRLAALTPAEREQLLRAAGAWIGQHVRP